ncbi:MAG: hypothetical protein V3U69_03595 [Bacteroidota bacterium]
MTDRTLQLTLLLLMAMNSFGQHLSSPRGISLAAYTAATNDIHSLDWNPAGLIFVKDWEASFSNFANVNPNFNGLIFGTAGIAKRFLGGHTVAIRYADGNAVEFIVPTLFVLTDSVSRLETSFDKMISHRERFAIGYAYRIADNISVGASARFREETVSDTRYFISQDTVTLVSSEVIDFDASSWLADVGALWEVNPRWRIGIVAKNLLRVTESEFSEEIEQFGLAQTRFARGGVSFMPLRSLSVALDFDTEERAALGYEWNLGNNFWIRQGVFADQNASPFIQAVSVGFGWSSPLFQADLSYLRFVDQTNRTGAGTLNAFTSVRWESPDWNPFTHDRIAFSLKVHLGRTHEQLAKIEYIEILSDVYPSSYQVYAYRPLGKVHVRNISGKPVQVKVGFFVDRLMERPTESKPYIIQPGQTIQIPFTAVFTPAIRSVTEMIIREAEVFVSAAIAGDYDDRSQARVLVHGRNDWSGDVLQLRYFVTPEDPEVLQFTRRKLVQYKDLLATVPENLQSFMEAKILFNEFSSRLSYVHDPKKSSDRVQYPAETLDLRGGDCDDMTVCYSSLLISVGIGVAYIDVIPPDRPQESHVYLMFDTGLEPQLAPLISENPKRYVVRKNDQGKETVWIPIETTESLRGFDAAWELGAKEYFNETGLNPGLIEGWVQVVDVHTIF